MNERVDINNIAGTYMTWLYKVPPITTNASHNMLQEGGTSLLYIDVCPF